MQTLIIRVYRRNHTNPEKLAGVVEAVGTGEKSTFQSFSGLVSALTQVLLQHNDPIEHMVGHDSYLSNDKKQAG